MRAVDIIVKKRNGQELLNSEIRFIIDGLVKGEVPDYQVSALLMAIYFNGMTKKEVSILTQAMKESGDSIDLSGLGGMKIDKHSTGGVGDKVSLVIAPLVASCGVKVPMMAGRGLGHTGGTLDKCESIPGYNINLTPGQFMEVLAKGGYAIMGQSSTIAPADRFMYALRDVTGTVESIPLITASILSKKCAEGADGFVFDVKTGSGAFMKDSENAESLALLLAETGKELGKRVCCVITDMDEPLGYTVGNLLEVAEVIDCLKGQGPADVMEVTFCLASHMLLLAGVAKNLKQAEDLCKNRLSGGDAWNKFVENVSLQGGNTAFLQDRVKWPVSPYRVPVKSLSSGFVQKMDAYKIGIAACLLGAGRAQKDDSIDPCAGIVIKKKTGDAIVKGDDLVLLHANEKEKIKTAEPLIHEAFIIGEKKPGRKKSRIIQKIGEGC
ncbi:MAG: thymidine phosphorylase [Spirochaetales bacterium]|nr:thymidine phosphorylase [Spirochaetales bacterium]